MERKTLRRAFYSREAKNLVDDDDDGKSGMILLSSISILFSYGYARLIFN